MTNEDLVSQITNAVNQRVDVPWIPESVEATLIRPVVAGVVAGLDETIKGYLVDASDGLDAGERLKYEAQLFTFVMVKLTGGVPVWFQPWVEGQLRGWVEPILHVIFDYTQKGLSVSSPEPA